MDIDFAEFVYCNSFEAASFDENSTTFYISFSVSFYLDVFFSEESVGFRWFDTRSANTTKLRKVLSQAATHYGPFTVSVAIKVTLNRYSKYRCSTHVGWLVSC